MMFFDEIFQFAQKYRAGSKNPELGGLEDQPRLQNLDLIYFLDLLKG